MAIATIALWAAYGSAMALDSQAAQTAEAPVSYTLQPGPHFILNGGLTYGGDTLATAVYNNGSTKDIKAGSLVQLGMGMLWQMQDRPLALQITANYQVDSVSGSNGSLTFSRYPIEGVLYYTAKERMRFGLGARYVLSPSYQDKVGIPYTANFDNTLGLVGEFGYAMSPVFWMNFRLVSEKYQFGTSSYSGNHAGINFTYQFE